MSPDPRVPLELEPEGVPPRRPASPRPSGRAASARLEKRGGGKLAVFLLANAIPAAAAVWFFTRSAAERQRILDAIPAGVGTRAVSAGAAFVLLLVLALGVLPGARAAIASLGRLVAWVRSRRTAARVALFPLEALAGLLRFLVQCVFAVDAVAILACGAAFILYVIRIVKPETFPWLPG